MPSQENGSVLSPFPNCTLIWVVSLDVLLKKSLVYITTITITFAKDFEPVTFEH